MQQKFQPRRFRQDSKPVPPESAPPAPPKDWRNGVRRIEERLRRAGWVGIGILVVLVALFTYAVSRPAEAQLTQGDVAALVASAMASATAPPSDASRVYAMVAPALVEVKASRVTEDGKPQQDEGSGVILDESGTILTSLHVVKDATRIRIIFFDNTEAPALVMAKDPSNDIAVLRPLQLPSQVIPATLGNPSDLHVGDEAIVVGNPFGIRHTLTAGVISGLGRAFKSPKTGESLQNLIQFDAAVNPGNSGGPLLNRDGEVVGIVNSLLNPTDQEVFIGIGFAVQIETAAAAAGSPPY